MKKKRVNIVSPKLLIKSELLKLSKLELITLYCLKEYDADNLPLEDIVEMIQEIDQDIEVDVEEIHKTIDQLFRHRIQFYDSDAQSDRKILPVCGMLDSDQCSVEVSKVIGVVLDNIIQRY